MSAASTSPAGASSAPNARANGAAGIRSTTRTDIGGRSTRGKALSHEERLARLAVVREGRRAGRTWGDIAGSLGLTEDGLRVWIDKAATMSMRPRVQRVCLRCRGRFMSEGPHHRLCCGPDSSVSPMAPDPGGSTGRRVGAGRQ